VLFPEASGNLYNSCQPLFGLFLILAAAIDRKTAINVINFSSGLPMDETDLLLITTRQMADGDEIGGATRRQNED